MLKTQLHSKLHQLTSDWRGIEDILTGDFFGILDYLPREPYLHNFISYIGTLNSAVETPASDGVDWAGVKLMFWPHTYTDEENAEPDIVILSNKWVLVIEVKLQSGLGKTQPWREYVVGCRMAEENGMSCDHVYYLLIARNRLDISSKSRLDQRRQLNKLSGKTSYLKWHEAVSLVDSWLRYGISGQTVLPEHTRMLNDLYNALKKRRSLTFSGFAFDNSRCVESLNNRFFCPPRFMGFLNHANQMATIDEMMFLSQEFKGFGCNCQVVNPVGSLFYSPQFDGFLNAAPVCTKHKNIFIEGS